MFGGNQIVKIIVSALHILKNSFRVKVDRKHNFNDRHKNFFLRRLSLGICILFKVSVFDTLCALCVEI